MSPRDEETGPKQLRRTGDGAPRDGEATARPTGATSEKVAAAAEAAQESETCRPAYCCTFTCGLARKVQAGMIEAAGLKWAEQVDGRLLEYATCGQEGGLPVYWAHGYVQTANFLTDFQDSVARRLGLYLISISMPGFGLSDSHPPGYKRSLLQWPQDVDLVLAKEGIAGGVFLVGTSAGCVHAAAFAHAFPDRVLGVLLNTPTAPHSALQGSTTGLAPASVFAQWVLSKRYIGDVFARAYLCVPFDRRIALMPGYSEFLSKLSQGDEEHRQVGQQVYADMIRATSRTHRGLTDNMHTVLEETPYALRDLGALTERGVKFWITTSPDDGINPPAMQRWWRDQVPGSELLHFPAGWGHLHAFAPNNSERLLALIASTRAPGAVEVSDEGR